MIIRIIIEWICPFIVLIVAREETNYSNPDGQIFITVGTGGQSIFEFTDRKPYVVSQFDEGFGFLDITIRDGGKRLVGTFYENDDGSIVDQFTVIKQQEEDDVVEEEEEDEDVLSRVRDALARVLQHAR